MNYNTFLKDAGVQSAIFLKNPKINEVNIKYFTNITCDEAVLVLRKDKKPLILLSPLVAKPRTSKFIIKDYSLANLKKIGKEQKSKSTGLDMKAISKYSFLRLKPFLGKGKIKDISKHIEFHRQVKSPSEVAKIKKAIAITEKILKKLIRKIPRFTYENEAIQFLQQEMIKENVQPAFDPIFASGKNSRLPHYYPTKTSKVLKGFCIIDFGVKYDGYCADISRTVFIGSPTKKQSELYEKVLGQQFKLEKQLKAGIRKFNLDFTMQHAVGHGIGLEIHEAPRMQMDKLQFNTVIAIEPALYNQKEGVRIEDDYIVKKSGLVRLSKGSRKLQILHKK